MVGATLFNQGSLLKQFNQIIFLWIEDFFQEQLCHGYRSLAICCKKIIDQKCLTCVLIKACIKKSKNRYFISGFDQRACQAHVYGDWRAKRGSHGSPAACSGLLLWAINHGTLSEGVSCVLISHAVGAPSRIKFTVVLCVCMPRQTIVAIATSNKPHKHPCNVV